MEAQGPKLLAHCPKAWTGGAQGFVFGRGRHFQVLGEGCQGPQQLGALDLSCIFQRTPGLSAERPHPPSCKPPALSSSCLSLFLALMPLCCASHAGSHPLELCVYDPHVAVRATWPTASHCEKLTLCVVPVSSILVNPY